MIAMLSEAQNRGAGIETLGGAETPLIFQQKG